MSPLFDLQAMIRQATLWLPFDLTAQSVSFLSSRNIWLDRTFCCEQSVFCFLNDATNSKWWLHFVLKRVICWISDKTYTILQRQKVGIRVLFIHLVWQHCFALAEISTIKNLNFFSIFFSKFSLFDVLLFGECYDNDKWSLLFSW